MPKAVLVPPCAEPEKNAVLLMNGTPFDKIAPLVLPCDSVLASLEPVVANARVF